MNFVDQLDPELRSLVQRLPADRAFDLNNMSAARARMKKLVAELLGSLPPV
jgi:hypothetical protein